MGPAPMDRTTDGCRKRPFGSHYQHPREDRMIAEVRTYKIKEGLRGRFLELFENKAIPAQRSKGMYILGPLLDLKDPDVFIWLRAFPSLEERDRMRSAFYDSEEWKTELEAIAMQ